MKNETYEQFVEKFKPKKTTDDCYTPEIVYDSIAEWVTTEYSLKKSDFVRPFYPGGDYENFDYTDKIVVDNPPFSILSQIIKFYVEHGVKFFLFAPTLTLCRYGDFCTVLPIGAPVIYENGANVNTSFVTNLEPFEIRAKTCPSLYKLVEKANKENQKNIKKQLPKYEYPDELVTTAQLYQYSKHGIDFVIPRSESIRVSALDSQRKCKKAVFGCGWLVSDQIKADRIKADQIKADREKIEYWQLSDKEKIIIKSLSKNH